jgi:hypothetical protein
VSEAGDLAMSTNIVARFGGEEFVVLLAEDERVDGAPSTEAATSLAEQIRAAVTALSIEGAGVTVSIGVASMPQDGSTADELRSATASQPPSGGTSRIRQDCIPTAEMPDEPETPRSDACRRRVGRRYRHGTCASASRLSC